MTINYSEFVAAALDLKHYLNTERLWSIFQHFDPDNQGFITVENVKDVAERQGRTLTQEEMASLVQEIGKKLDFNQFCQLLNPSLSGNVDSKKKPHAIDGTVAT